MEISRILLQPDLAATDKIFSGVWHLPPIHTQLLEPVNRGTARCNITIIKASLLILLGGKLAISLRWYGRHQLQLDSVMLECHKVEHNLCMWLLTTTQLPMW